MDHQYLVWLIVLPFIIFAMVPFLSARKDPARAKALNRYARRMDLAITDDVRPTVIDRIRTHERFGLIGAAYAPSFAAAQVLMSFVGAAVVFGLIGAIIVITVLGASQSPSRHFRRRLWSDRSPA